MPVIEKRLRSDSGFESPGFSVDSAGTLDAVSVKVNGSTIFTSTSLGSSIVSSSLTSLGTLTGLTVQGNLNVSSGSVANISATAVNISSGTSGNLTLLAGASGTIIVGASNSGNTTITAGTGKTVTITSPSTGNIDNMIIGATTAADARVNNLTILGTFSLATQTFLTSNPATTSTIDNYNIGSIAPGTGTFTTLTATTGNITTVNATNLNATSTVSINPSSVGAIDNVGIGTTTASTGRFTTVTITSEPTLASHATTKQYVDNKIPALAIALGA